VPVSFETKTAHFKTIICDTIHCSWTEDLRG